MKVLVTGAAGFIGSHVAERFLETIIEDVIADRGMRLAEYPYARADRFAATTAE